MKKQLYQGLKIGIFIIAAAFVSCKNDDYLNDGGVHDPKVNMTTYDYLKSNPKFDSLIRIIDKAGMKDEINGNITFFATTNWGVADYVAAKRQKKVIEVGDENITFTIDDLNTQELRDSLGLYMFDGHIGRENLTPDGAFYTSKLGQLGGNSGIYIRLRRTRDYNTYTNFVDYVNFAKVIGTLDETEADLDNIPEDELDDDYDCQTSGIITTTGTLHVLQGTHKLFFNNESAGN